MSNNAIFQETDRLHFKCDLNENTSLDMTIGISSGKEVLVCVCVCVCVEIMQHNQGAQKCSLDYGGTQKC
jgi:hypothetical protein